MSTKPGPVPIAIDSASEAQAREAVDTLARNRGLQNTLMMLHAAGIFAETPTDPENRRAARTRTQVKAVDACISDLSSNQIPMTGSVLFLAKFVGEGPERERLRDHVRDMLAGGVSICDIAGRFIGTKTDPATGTPVLTEFYRPDFEILIKPQDWQSAPLTPAPQLVDRADTSLTNRARLAYQELAAAAQAEP